MTFFIYVPLRVTVHEHISLVNKYLKKEGGGVGKQKSPRSLERMFVRNALKVVDLS